MSRTERPLLRWAGSKRRLLPYLLRYWGDGYPRYVEPFMGSAVLFLAIRPEAALLSDINGNLVETLVAVRDHPLAVYNRLCKLPVGETSYYQIRNQTSVYRNKLDRAARFLYLNRFCFNGLYRTNLKGDFNVPFADAKTTKLPTRLEIFKTAEVLASAVIKSCDFADTLADVRDGDFVYMDPPYAVKNRRVFRQYGPDSFGVDDINRLAKALYEIDQRGAVFVLSYALCKEALHAFREWNIQRVLTQRSVAGFARHRKKAFELIISNRQMSRLTS